MTKKFLNFRHFKSDLLGGITAGIVALPLALAFGEQSGLGAAAGLYGAAFIAFFASFFGGTPTQISGPTAPMTALSMVIVAGVLQVFEGKMELALPVILAVFLLAGVFQIIMGVLKLGTYIRFIPHTVVSGFMSGIGVIILITQVLPAIGYYSQDDPVVINQMKPHAEELILERILEEEAEDGILVLEEFRETIARAESISEEDIQIEAKMLAANASKGVWGSVEFMPQGLKNIKWLELLLSALTIAIIYLFPKITKAIPSTLVAMIAVAWGAYLLGLDYVKISEIPTGVPKFRSDIITGFDIAAFSPYIFTALMLAMLGAIDSLLTAVVADNLTRVHHNSDKELVGQGVANGISAFFGGLPGAGATIRTVVNIQAGGKTKMSGMTAGILLFAVMLFLGPLASMIPAAVLAGVLITVGIGVMDWRGLRALPRMDFSEKIVMLTVLILTVFWDLVPAVFLGLVIAALVFLKRMSDLGTSNVSFSDLTKVQKEDPLWPDELAASEKVRSKVMFKHMDGPMFFGMVSDFRKLIAALPDLHLLVIRMEEVPFIDQSGIKALDNAIEVLNKQDVVVILCGANKQVEGQLRAMRLIPKTISESHVFKNFDDCRAWLRQLVQEEDSLDLELKKLKAWAGY
ncbi:MAG: SulP family inorganic anion transporter [Flavobacteriales bacterium]|nr:SulP family inorganic anion transporter [Flavobacteriales bacterium]